MAEIIAGVAMSHSPLIMTSEDAAGEKGQRFLQTTKEIEEMVRRYRSRCDRINF